MQRHMILTGALGAMMLALAACSGAVDTGQGDASTPAASSDETGGIPRPAACDDDNPYLAVALPNLTNPYYVAMKKGFEDAGEAQGFEVEVQIADDDDANQLAQVQSTASTALSRPCRSRGAKVRPTPRTETG